ncbi:hypothetical protein D3C78_1594320 [compost metagenome]
MRDRRHQRGHPRDVPALFEGLVDAAPDHVLHLGRIDQRVARQQLGDQLRRQVLGTGVAMHAALGTAHRRAAEVDDHHVSRIQAHKILLLQW